MNEEIKKFVVDKRFASMQAFIDAGIKRFSRITLEELKRAMAIIEDDNQKYERDSFIFKTKNIEKKCLVWSNTAGKGSKVSKSDDVCILHFHSGGYVTGSELTSAQFCEALFRYRESTIICPDYPLCPDMTIPEIVDWSLELLSYLNSLGYEKFVLTGVSAGANLVALCALENALRDYPFDIEHIHLITGHYQSDFDTHSANKYESGEESGLSKSMLLKLLKYAIGDHDIHLQDPRIFPLYSDELSLLPKTNIYVAKYDVLHDDSLLFYEKLLRQGVDVSYNEYSDGFHAWTNYLMENPSLLKFAKDNIFKQIFL